MTRLGMPLSGDNPLVVSVNGLPVTAKNMREHLHQIRRAQVAARSNGALCKILRTARFKGQGCTKPYHKKQVGSVSLANPKQ